MINKGVVNKVWGLDGYSFPIISYPFPIQLLFILYSIHIQFLFTSYAFRMHFLFTSLSFLFISYSFLFLSFPKLFKNVINERVGNQDLGLADVLIYSKNNEEMKGNDMK